MAWIARGLGARARAGHRTAGPPQERQRSRFATLEPGHCRTAACCPRSNLPAAPRSIATTARSHGGVATRIPSRLEVSRAGGRSLSLGETACRRFARVRPGRIASWSTDTARPGYVRYRPARGIHPAAVPCGGGNVAHRSPWARCRVAGLSTRRAGRPSAERRDGVIARHLLAGLATLRRIAAVPKLIHLALRREPNGC